MAQIWGHIYNIVHIILVNPYNNSYKTNEISFLSECFINALILLLSALGASFGGCLKRSRPAPINVGSRWYKADAVFYRKLLQQLCGYSDYSFMVSSVHILASWRYLFPDLLPHNSNACIYTGSHSQTLWEKLILEITTLRFGNFLYPLPIRDKSLLASCPSVCLSERISAAPF